jgi:hypothetical protein
MTNRQLNLSGCAAAQLSSLFPKTDMAIGVFLELCSKVLRIFVVS